ncbi:NUDIX domain-containing protein [Chryseobacterium sp. HSC-36S06]|uniref:NUDIX domain-containing protein n=1 Tax=Chryseobacterium sp. HSC-36S06 TaxID=2910970 RepID=UPI00209F8287|nr:NUDIX domain-containing protein [Chryseobacterium sp. HSC-36S06]MCP2038513.1 8-oxo-dGTP pyrophosphatase MutT (NUDIX family) [Chryseobacterium sp. HSC-36S06]
MIDKLNIRVYATAVKDGKVLVLHEEYAGEQLMKLPGGGLEFGEGVLDCLHREFEEELNVKIKILGHLYTQEDFVISRFRENEQLLTIYYLVEIIDENDFLIMDPCIEKTEWIPIHTDENPFILPVDKIAFENLKERLL